MCDEAGVETRTDFRVTALRRVEGGFEAFGEEGTASGRCALVCPDHAIEIYEVEE